MTELRPRDGQRAALEDALFGSWTVDAACRNQELPGRLYRDAFTDEVGQLQDLTKYAWPERTVNALRTCAGCPVRRECLKAEFDSNASPRHFGVRGGTPGRIREVLGFQPCPGCEGRGYLKRMKVGNRVLRWQDYAEMFKADQRGFPCRTCSNTGKIADEHGLEKCETWADDYAADRGWTLAERRNLTA